MAVYRNINVRSPFFSQLATSEPLVDLELRVWVGLLSSKPTDPTYTMTKEQTGGQATFEIAELIRDSISQSASLVSGTAWVEVIMDDRDATPTETIYVASEGYKLFTEGVQNNGNSWESDFVALPEYSAGNYKVLVGHDRYSIFSVYVQPQNSTDWKYTVNKTDGSSYDEILFEVDSSQAKFVNIQIGKDISSIDLDMDGELATVQAIYTDCSKYNMSPTASQVVSGNIDDSKHVSLMYVNKYGARTQFPFTLKHIESIEVSSDGFHRNNINYNSLNTYNGKHAFRKRITGSKQSFVANTDWLDQYFVKQMEEMIMSEYVWARVSTVNDTTYFPVNIKTKKLEKKNHLNDKLIQYSVQFETASEYINTVR